MKEKTISTNSVLLKVLRWINALKNKKQFVRTALTKTGAATGSVTNENRDSDNDEPPFLGLTRITSKEGARNRRDTAERSRRNEEARCSSF